jgi:hypothetical protein
VQEQGKETLHEGREGSLMSAAERRLKRFVQVALAAFLLLGVPLFGPAAASATMHVESFDFTLTDAGGAATQQAGGHPAQTTTTLAFASYKNAEEKILPVEQPRNLTVDLPVGMVGNATVLPTCNGSQLVSGTCPNDSAVGFVSLEVPFANFCSICGPPGPFTFPIYNLQPPPGVPAEFGFNALGATVVHLVAHVRSEPEYGISITTRYNPQGLPYTGLTTTFWGSPADPLHDPLRGSCLGFFGSVGSCASEVPVPRPFLTNPTACSASLTAITSVDSWATPDVFDVVSAANEDGSGEPVGISGCDQPEFKPEIEARPTTNLADSPSGLDVKLHIPQNEDPEELASAQLKDATLSLPPGMTINPASAPGLDACSPAQVGLRTPVGQPLAHFDEAPVSCPNAAKLGTVRIDTPLIATPLEGAIYLAAPHENPFNSLLALYIVVEDPITGVIIKLAGHPVADPQSGQLTVSFDQNPQLPFEDLEVNLFPGSGGALKTPMTCGEFITTSELVPWTAPEGAAKNPTDTFGIVAGAGNSPCLKSEAEAPNTPTFSAGSKDPTAGAYSPFVLKLTRADGTQPIKGIDTTLPKGLLGRLVGIPYCSDGALAAAAGKSGRAEQTSPSCPVASQVGTVAVGAGAGSTPLYVGGKAYLAGPYKGAPLSLAIVTPAVAGPFDLGNVVVRTALQINPETAQVHAVSDPIPTILKGIPLDLRSIALTMDRSNFTLNPTSCGPTTVSAGATSVFDQTAALSSPFQVGGCGALRFKPKLAIDLKGGTRRSDYPALRATLKTRSGDANISRAVVSLPHSEFLAQSHIRTVCTRVQFAADACPRRSIYGRATAISPLLDKPLSGPVYLRSSSNPLPDLVADLNGQIRVTLAGRIDSVKGGIRTSFELIPDAPVSKFVLEMQGGKKGLLENSRNLCNSTNKAGVELDGQNGKIHDFDPVVTNDCKKSKRKAKPRRRG